MKILSLFCMSLVFCLFAGANQAEARNAISGTNYNFVPTDYSKGEARVVKTSLPPPPSPRISETSMTIIKVVGIVLLVFLLVLIVWGASPSGRNELDDLHRDGP